MEKIEYTYKNSIGAMVSIANKYKVVQPIVLGFMTPRDQYDEIIKNGIIEIKEGHMGGASFYWNGKESITCVMPALKYWIEDGYIEPVEDENGSK